MGAAALVRQKNFISHNNFVDNDCSVKSELLCEVTKEDRILKEKFKFRVHLYEIFSFSQFLPDEKRFYYEVSCLHCYSGRESHRIYLNYNIVNKIYDEVVLISVPDAYTSVTVSEVDLSALESFIFNHITSVQDFISACTDVVAFSDSKPDDMNFELRLNRLITRAEIMPLIYTVEADFDSDFVKRDRILTHNATMRIVQHSAR
jgi:hypothetical protein